MSSDLKGPKVLHFILGKADKNKPNGVNQVIAGLCKYLPRHDIDVSVMGYANSARAEGEVVARDGFNVSVFSRFSRAFLSALFREVQGSSLVHLHGIYNIYNILVSYVCVYLKTPYIITLHDGLSPVRFKNKKRFLKCIFNFILQKRFILRAKAIHVLTEEEASDVIGFGFSGDIFLVPNGVDIDDFGNSLNSGMEGKRRERLRIGYLGRISREKNIDGLVSGFLSSDIADGCDLLLAGPLDSSYAREFQEISSNIFCVGPLYGEEKMEFIRSLDLFVHPAKCDVFSIGAMECLASGTPLLITRTSNAAYFYNRDAFYMCEPTAFGIRRGLESACSERLNWDRKVKNGYTLIEEVFNWDRASSVLAQYYMELLQYVDKNRN